MPRKLQVIMLLAGAGSRFTKAGFETPKPLIEVDHLPMFQKALSSIDGISSEKSFFFVIQQQHADSQKLDQLIKQAQPEANVIIIPKLTRGAVETGLAAENQLSMDDGLIIMDCDLWFHSKGYNQMIEDSLNGKNDIDGGLLTFASQDPRYSYAKVDDEWRVSETAEKRVISDRAITGAYFFATAQNFIDSAQQLLNKPISDTMPEYYLSLLYNILIDEGEKIQAAIVDEFASFGTPDELEQYQESLLSH